MPLRARGWSMLTTPLETERPSEPVARWHAEWVARLGPADQADSASRRWRSESADFSVSRTDGSDVRIAEGRRHVVIFAGALLNAAEIDPAAGDRDAARLTLGLFESIGWKALERLRGPFVVLVWDRAEGTLQVARDQVGLEPMFYARGGGVWWFSPSPDVLAALPGVSRAIDAVALSEWLCGWFPAVEDTAYRDVKRVPPAVVMTIRGADTQWTKYWDPFRADEPIEYLREEELDRFDQTLARAVGRTLSVGPSSIFLSGGLDSVAVAVAATDAARSSGMAAPLALSLRFPDGEANEETIQAGAAAGLGLPQRLLPFDQAVGERGLLAEALALSATWPQPMWNLWAPAYLSLARMAAADGRRLLLTGRGGDEWVAISPYLLADQLRSGRIVQAWRLLRMRQRSNHLTARQAARVVWMTAGRPLASAALDWLAPGIWHGWRRRRLLSERPAWVAPDPSIRRAMDDRIERWIDPARPPGGFYQREARQALRHPAITHDLEETQEFGRRLGMRMLHPFWDVDVIELAHRVPPALLMKDGRSKWLLRRQLAERLPGLGLERRGKASAQHVFRDLMTGQAPEVWRQLGGPAALGRIGVVDVRDVESSGPQSSLARRWGGSGRLWTMLNLETWVRQRSFE